MNNLSFSELNLSIQQEIDSVSSDLPKDFESMKNLLDKMNKVCKSFASLHRPTTYDGFHSVTDQNAFDETKSKLIKKFDTVSELWTQYKKERTWTQASKDAWSESKVKKTFKKNKEKLKTLEYGVNRREERWHWYEKILLPLTTLATASEIGANAAFMGYAATH